MPTEPSIAKLKRKARRRTGVEYFNFDNALAREVEDKRSRGEVSCAECRRLKIKCDKQIPCQSCQRRGCTSLCPNGSLSTGQGTRFVLAATEHLHNKIERLTGRIRQLEDALSTSQSQLSEQPHPLLRKDLLDLAVSSSSPELDLVLPDDDDFKSDSPPIDMHGTLSISSQGVSRFFGATGGCESFIIASEDLAERRSLSPQLSSGSLSPTTTVSEANDLISFAQSFPLSHTSQNSAGVFNTLMDNIPSRERALSLITSYFGLSEWFVCGIGREQIAELIAVVFREQPSASPYSSCSPHDLSLLFIVFAVGSVSEQDEERPEEAEHFHHLSRAAISIQSVLEKPSLVTVQCIHLLSIYNALIGGDPSSDTTMETTWSMTRLAAQLAHSVGLHRDAERWNLSSQMIQRRRVFFWDLYVCDIWQSLHTGRPPSFDLAFVDCKYPQADGDDAPDAANWQLRFAVECVSKVTARLLASETTSYSEIMELDAMVRAFPLPDPPAKNDVASSWERFILDHIRETVLMYLHRNYFAQAFLDDPVNPLKSTFAHSVLTTYRASSTILKCVGSQFNQWTRTCGRFWTMWTFSLSAAFVFGTVVTGGPRSPLASSAMKELKEACKLFSKAAYCSKYAKQALPILAKLSARAHNALAVAQAESRGTPSSPERATGDERENDLLIFGGGTWFLSRDFDKRVVPLAEPDIRLRSPGHGVHSPPEHGARPVLLHSCSYESDVSQAIGFEVETLHQPQLALDTARYAAAHDQTMLADFESRRDSKKEAMYAAPYIHVYIPERPMAAESSRMDAPFALPDPKIDQWHAFLRSSGADIEAIPEFHF